VTANELRLRVWDGAQHAPVEVPLYFDAAIAAIEVRCLPGASGIQVVLSDGDGVRLRAEVMAEPGEVVPLGIEIDEHGLLNLSSRGREIVYLPGDSRYEPPLPIRATSAETPLDLAIVVDGTTRSWPEKVPGAVGEQEVAPASTSAGRLLDRKDLWSAHVEKLTAFVEAIVAGRDAPIAILAFGDQNPPAVTAGDLLPRYHLHPPEDERMLQTLDAVRLQERLVALPSSPGADFVDATADALDACARLHWRKTARKIVLLTGDSPGASLLHPLPKGADLCVRHLDVDTRAFTLYRLGVELVTIYHEPPRTLGLHAIAPQRDLLAAARDQYERLASLPELAFEEASFEPEIAARRLRELTDVVARGVALGELAHAAAGEGAIPLNGAAPPARPRAARGR
jgi:hypothetical protein